MIGRPHKEAGENLLHCVTIRAMRDNSRNENIITTYCYYCIYLNILKVRA
jgi:hypothetical protein